MASRPIFSGRPTFSKTKPDAGFDLSGRRGCRWAPEEGRCQDADKIGRIEADEQRKLIKYDYLVANCLIFYNVCAMTKALHQTRKEGMRLDADTLARLSPYLTGHVNRFGEYRFDLNRQPPPIDYQLPILGF